MTDARESHFRELLKKICNEIEYNDPVIETAAIPTTGANFSSQLFTAFVKSTGKEDLHLFAKVAVVGESLREQAGPIDFFAVEPHFYTKVARRYKEIEDKHDIPEEHRLNVPKFYGHSDEYLKEIIVLEDLAKRGFVTWDRLKSIDWEYASTAIEQLAIFHALSIAFQNEYPEEYEEGKKIMRRDLYADNGSMIQMVKQSIERVTAIVKEENKSKIQAFFAENLKPEEFMKVYTPLKRPVIAHSDYRQSNLMHRYDEDGKVTVIPVDYQTLHSGSVAIDLFYFIFTGSDGAFRAAHYDQLIDYYYQNLTEALKRLDLDPEKEFPRSVFDEELKELLPFGLIISSLILPLITIDIDHVTAGKDAYENESMEALTELIGHTNDLCTKRLNEVVDDYVRWGVL